MGIFPTDRRAKRLEMIMAKETGTFNASKITKLNPIIQ